MSSSKFTSPQLSDSSGYNFHECTCCPYGYHVDLDFVRYCESICQETDRTASIKRRKDRRRQRHSMEVLLGITQPVLYSYDQGTKISDTQDSIAKQKEDLTKRKFMYILQNDFASAISDFEKVLRPIENRSPSRTVAELRKEPYLPSTSSISNSTVSVFSPEKSSTKGFESNSTETSSLSPMVLQKIREQMALSLERTRQLEDEVKIIPQLKEQVSSLKEENAWLMIRLRQYETNKVQQKDEAVDSGSSENVSRKDAASPIPRKDFGVMCGVLTRNIGVGNQAPSMKTVSTEMSTTGLDFSDKWYEEKLKFLGSHHFGSVPELQKAHNLVSRGTQTVFTREKRNVALQTLIELLPPKKVTSEIHIQTDGSKSVMLNKGISALPEYKDFIVQKATELVTVAVSDDRTDSIICEKCKAIKKSIAVGPDSNEDAHTSPISLASLSFPRSKSFNLGDDKLSLSKRSRTVACQYENTNIPKSSQTEPKTVSSKVIQSTVKMTDGAVQSEIETSVRSTDTKGLLHIKHVACEAKEPAAKIVKKCDVASNTTALHREKSICSKCSNVDKEEVVKKEGGSPTPSRIPRPQMPTTPIENRKFKRQDTYTVSTFSNEKATPSSPKSPTKQNAELNFDNGALQKPKSVQVLEKSAAREGISSVTSSSSNTTRVQVQETSLPVLKTVALTSVDDSERKKAEPSSEMRGAMKVLNDALQKSQTKHVVNSRAVDIVREEWFRISSHATANPLQVEDYLDIFEEMSSTLLEYIVNMTDSSGNTAMHYAVSHGNFDVVSILLDSKVCNINRPNKAGYTSVMLVSLAQIKSQAHACVVKRLFHLADVNIRASEHGQTALMLAVSHGRLDMVKMLIEAGADINIQDADGSTALMCAAEHGHIEIVKYFLSQPDCDVTITDVDGSTALKIAMEAGHRHIGVLLYAHERNLQMAHGSKSKKSKTGSPKPTSSPLPTRSSHSALSDSKK